MAELTQEQVERAVAAVEKLQRSNMDIGSTVAIRDVICVAAPFLQLPWDEPTEEEIQVAYESTEALPLPGGSLRWLKEFVRRRNAALITKPFDPRKAKIVAALEGLALKAARERMADLIILALDSQ